MHEFRLRTIVQMVHRNNHIHTIFVYVFALIWPGRSNTEGTKQLSVWIACFKLHATSKNQRWSNGNSGIVLVSVNVIYPNIGIKTFFLKIMLSNFQKKYIKVFLQAIWTFRISTIDYYRFSWMRATKHCPLMTWISCSIQLRSGAFCIERHSWRRLLENAWHLIRIRIQLIQFLSPTIQPDSHVHQIF